MYSRLFLTFLISVNTKFIQIKAFTRFDPEDKWSVLPYLKKGTKNSKKGQCVRKNDV